MRNSAFISLFSLASLACVLPAQAQAPSDAPTLRGESQSIAVFPLKARRMDAEMVAVVEDVWTKNFPAGFKVIRAPELRDASATVCTEAPCVARRTDRKAELGIAGEISRLGGSYFIRLQLMDGKSGVRERTVDKACAATEDNLVSALREATAELLGVELQIPQPPPSANLVAKATAPISSATPTTTYVKVPNKNRQKALYVCLGGAVVASAGTLLAFANTQNDETTNYVAGSAIGLGLLSFAIGGAVYVVSNDHELRMVATPTVTSKSAGLTVAGQF